MAQHENTETRETDYKPSIIETLFDIVPTSTALAIMEAIDQNYKHLTPEAQANCDKIQAEFFRGRYLYPSGMQLIPVV